MITNENLQILLKTQKFQYRKKIIETFKLKKVYTLAIRGYVEYAYNNKLLLVI